MYCCDNVHPFNGDSMNLGTLELAQVTGIVLYPVVLLFWKKNNYLVPQSL
jgi:hypothetical protein